MKTTLQEQIKAIEGEVKMYASRMTWHKHQQALDDAAATLKELAAGRFKMPTDQQVIEFALVFNDGRIQPDKLADMVGFCQMVIDRLHDNGDIMVKSKQEIEDLKNQDQ